MEALNPRLVYELPIAARLRREMFGRVLVGVAHESPADFGVLVIEGLVSSKLASGSLTRLMVSD